MSPQHELGVGGLELSVRAQCILIDNGVTTVQQARELGYAGLLNLPRMQFKPFCEIWAALTVEEQIGILGSAAVLNPRPDAIDVLDLSPSRTYQNDCAQSRAGETEPSVINFPSSSPDLQEARDRGRHLGFFDVSCRFVRFPGKETAAIFDRMLVVQTEYRFETDVIRYLGVHPSFDYVREDELPPTYSWIGTCHADGRVSGDWSRPGQPYREAETG